MKISHSHKLFAVTITILLVIIGIIVFKALNIQDDVIRSEQHRFRSFLLAVELFQSSEDLTRMASSYVSMGKPIYEKRYFEILDIRNGKQSRPANYNATYWHLAGVGRGPAVAQGETISLQELMRREGFTQQEFSLLWKSQANSDHLVNMEKQAFAAMKGLYDDGHGNFTVRRAPNLDYAIRLLYSDEYSDEKARIMAPIQQFMEVLDQRTNAELISFQSQLRQYILLALAFIAITLCVVIVQILHTIHSILYPIERLRSKVAEIATGNFAARCDIFSANEIGELSANFNGMANFIEAEILTRKKAEEELRKSEDYLSATLRSIGDGVITCDVWGKIININTAAEKLTGWSTDEAAGRPIVEIFHTIHNETRQEAEDLVGRTLRENRVLSMAIHTALIARDGTEYQIADSCAPIHDSAGGIIGAVLIFRDISEEYYRRERTESRRTLSYELLGILNSPTDLPDMINAVVLLIKRWTGFDAVGIRLQAGDDFPYFAQNGFSDEFLLAENTLVEHGKDGGLCRDKDGNVSLQCTCGLVISGKTDPANPLFTPGGSFWTNNSFSLLELPSDKDPRIHPRNRCMHEGYGSLALIPLFENQKIVGLLQFNNRKKDSLTLDTISFFELISAYIGETLMRKKAEWALKERFKELNCLYGISALIELPDISLEELLKKTIYLLPPAWQFPEITQARITLERKTFQTEHFRETPWMQVHKIIVNGKPTGQVEVCYLEERPISDEGPFLIEERQLIKAIAERLGRVIERKQAEDALANLSRQNELILNSAAEGILRLDLQGNHTFINSAAARMFDYEVEELIGRPSHSTWHHTKPDGSPYPKEECKILTAFMEGIVCSVSNEVFWRKDGTSFPVEYASTPIYEHDRVVGVVVTFTDITERKRTENYRDMGNEILQIISKPGTLHDLIQSVITAFKTWTGFDAVGIRLRNGDDFPYFAQNGFSNEFLLTENTLTERRADGGVCRDKDGNIRLECTCGLVISGKTDPANPLFTKGGSAWTNDSFPLLDLPSDQDPRLHPRNQCIHQGYASVALVPIRTKDQVIGLLQFNDRRKNCFSLAAIEQFEDIAANIGEALLRKDAEEALLESEERYHFIADHTADHIWTMDLSLRYIYSSPAVTRILGYTIDEFMTQSIDQFFTPESLVAAKKVLMGELKTDKTPNADPNRVRTFQSEHRHKNGNLVWLESSITIIRDTSMKPIGILGVSRDITERKKAEEQIQYLATHDLLTDLPSLRLANDRLSVALNMARRYKKAVAVMFIDLDGFKTVNDTIGHDAGDYVLKQVAQRMLSCVRETDTVARVGGDEFLIISTEINAPENAAQIAEKVIQIVSQPFMFKEQQAVVGASIGIALFPDHGKDMDELIKQADKAMYRVKNAGKNGFRFVNK